MPEAAGGAEPGGTAPAGGTGGASAAGGALSAGGVSAAGGAGAELSLEELRESCDQGCGVLVDYCGVTAINCEELCGSSLDTLGPCPRVQEAFECLLEIARSGVDCTPAAATACLPISELLFECGGGEVPGPESRICGANPAIPSPGVCHLDVSACEGGQYGVHCEVSAPNLAACDCFSGDGPGPSIEVAMDPATGIQSVCIPDTIVDCGYPIRL